MNHRLLTAAMLLSWTACSAQAQRRQPPADWLEECRVGGVSEIAWCGAYTVYENRAAASGRTIPLKVVVVPAYSTAPEPDPVVFLQGGPGAAATEAIAAALDILQHARDKRDIVFVDRRGTGSSAPLDCPREGGLQWHFDEFLEIGFVERCRDSLTADHDLTQYTTANAADDYAEVLRALGYERANFYGVSGGTRLAQVLIRRHPGIVRTAVLKGVVPMDRTSPLQAARYAQRTLDTTFAACSTDPPCSRAFPDLEGDWRRVLAQFAGGPITTTVRDPRTGTEETVTISKGRFGLGIRAALYSVWLARHLPRIVHAAAAGDFSDFAQQELDRGVNVVDRISFGLWIAVTCSELVRFIDEKEIGQATQGTFLGDYEVRRHIAACRRWPLAEVPISFRDPVAANTPVLLLSGALDAGTPPEGGDAVAKHLPNSLHVVVPNEGHFLANSRCELPLIAEVIRRGTTEGLDTSCVQETRRPPFVLDLKN